MVAIPCPISAPRITLPLSLIRHSPKRYRAAEPFRRGVQAAGARPVRDLQPRPGGGYRATAARRRGQLDFSPATNILRCEFPVCLPIRLVQPCCGHVIVQPHVGTPRREPPNHSVESAESNRILTGRNASLGRQITLNATPTNRVLTHSYKDHPPLTHSRFLLPTDPERCVPLLPRLKQDETGDPWNCLGVATLAVATLTHLATEPPPLVSQLEFLSGFPEEGRHQCPPLEGESRIRHRDG